MYFLSPQINLLRHSVGLPEEKRSSVFIRSWALSFTVSTVWNGRVMRMGATRFPSLYLPCQMISAMVD